MSRIVCVTWTTILGCTLAVGTLTATGQDQSFEAGDVVQVKETGGKVYVGKTPIAEVAEGTNLTVIYVNGNWLGVTVVVDGQEARGWISSKHVRSSGDNTVAKSATGATSAIGSYKPGDVVQVKEKGAMVYVGGTAIAEVAEGKNLRVTHINSKWLGVRVRVDGQEARGWILSKHVRLAGDNAPADLVTEATSVIADRKEAKVGSAKKTAEGGATQVARPLFGDWVVDAGKCMALLLNSGMERGYAALEIAAYYELKVSIDENAVTLKGDLIEGKIQYRATKGNAEAVVFEGMRGVPANSQEFKRFSITPAGQKEAVLQFLDPRHKAPPLFLTKG